MDCETNQSHSNSTLGLNIYKIKDIDNFAIIDSPGNDEIKGSLKMFASKGNLYSKMFIYLIKEDSVFTLKSLENNILLELIKLRIKYKIQLLILLTHADTYCNLVKADGNEKWKETCKLNIEDNKKQLLDYLNSEIKKYDINNFQLQKNDIRHICLVGSENKMTDEEIVKGFDSNTLIMYNNAKSEEEKNMIKKIFNNISNSKNNDVKEFLKNEIQVLEKNEIIEEIKKRIPAQYHKCFKLVK